MRSKLIISTLAGLLYCTISLGQSTPANDAFWSTGAVTMTSDEFTTSSLNTSFWQNAVTSQADWRMGLCSLVVDGNCKKWINEAYLSYPGEGSYGNFDFSHYNTSTGTGTGYVSLIVKQLGTPVTVSNQENKCTTPSGSCSSTYSYSAPKSMLSAADNYTFGYYEVRCQMPVLTGTVTPHGIGPNFWMISYGSHLAGCSDEIDVFETVANSSGYVVAANTHHITCPDCSVNSSCSDYRDPNLGDDYGIASAGLSGWHKYGVGWYPDRVEFFLDDVLKHTRYSTGSNDFNTYRDMTLVLDINVSPWIGGPIDNTTLLPYSYDVDYVRYYKLPFNCTSFTPNSYTSIPLYDNKVRSDIYLGGTSKTYIVPASAVVAMKGGTSITLDEGFEVGTSAEFSADVVGCH